MSRYDFKITMKGRAHWFDVLVSALHVFFALWLADMGSVLASAVQFFCAAVWAFTGQCKASIDDEILRYTTERMLKQLERRMK